MTPQYEPNGDELDRCGKELEEIIGHVQHVRRKVDDISTRLQDSYELLREILDSIDRENGASWHDLYGTEEEY